MGLVMYVHYILYIPNNYTVTIEVCIAHDIELWDLVHAIQCCNCVVISMTEKSEKYLDS
jgi:hypothetical protein